MKLQLIYQDGKAYIKEDNRFIYQIEEEKEQGLLTIHLNNMYGEEIVSVYQVSKLSTMLNKKKNDFTIYDHDLKLGELHKVDGSYEIQYHGIYYRFFGGLHLTKRHIICFDQEQQIAEFIFDQECVVRFRNITLNPICSLLLYVFDRYIPAEKFSKKEYLYHYRGLYTDTYEFEG